jgi:hypothetical protein
MPEFLNHSNQVRYRTEKPLFFSLFAAKFRVGDAANQMLCIFKEEGGFGLVH